MLSGSSFKTQLPIFRDGNAEELLHFLCEFNQAKSTLGYTTHQKLESSLEQLIQGNTWNEWYTIKTTISSNSHTVPAFSENLLHSKNCTFPNHWPLIISVTTYRELAKMINYQSLNFLTDSSTSICLSLSSLKPRTLTYLQVMKLKKITIQCLPDGARISLIWVRK